MVQKQHARKLGPVGRKDLRARPVASGPADPPPTSHGPRPEAESGPGRARDSRAVGRGSRYRKFKPVGPSLWDGKFLGTFQRGAKGSWDLVRPF